MAARSFRDRPGTTCEVSSCLREKTTLTDSREFQDIAQKRVCKMHYIIYEECYDVPIGERHPYARRNKSWAQFSKDFDLYRYESDY